MKQMVTLGLSRTAIKELPFSIGNLVKLQKLKLEYCSNLELVPSSIKNTSLEILNLSGSMIKEMPLNINLLSKLFSKIVG